MVNKNNEAKTPNWLVELQQKSWEPEILLSGIVLYGMFKMPDLLDQSLLFFETSVLGSDSSFNFMVYSLKVGIYWLIGGLILHLVSRGVWVGMVGLSYTFPNGINTQRLKYKEPFASRLNRTPGYIQSIENLEKISSSLFALSFLLFMCVLGAYVYIMVLIIVPGYFYEQVFEFPKEGLVDNIFSFYILAVLVIGFVSTVDFVTIGFFRRYKWVAKIYWPFYWLASLLTLSRFYRSVYYGLISNVNRWGVFTFFIVFCFATVFIFNMSKESSYPGDGLSSITYWSNTLGYGAFNGYYDDQNQEKFSVRASIPSDVIDGNVLRLFVVAHVDNQDSITAWTKKLPQKIKFDSLKGAAKMSEAVRTYFRVKIDDSEYDDLPMKFHFKSHTQQKGYLFYIDISGLNRGLHDLTLSVPRGESAFQIAAKIPFYRDLRLNSGLFKAEP
ncbi:MAG: hypothetical protein ACI8QD_000083 [Cyclobacteriaceae bacterium]|jgi:hypothetical protein